MCRNLVLTLHFFELQLSVNKRDWRVISNICDITERLINSLLEADFMLANSVFVKMVYIVKTSSERKQKWFLNLQDTELSNLQLSLQSRNQCSLTGLGSKMTSEGWPHSRFKSLRGWWPGLHKPKKENHACKEMLVVYSPTLPHEFHICFWFKQILHYSA